MDLLRKFYLLLWCISLVTSTTTDAAVEGVCPYLPHWTTSNLNDNKLDDIEYFHIETRYIDNLGYTEMGESSPSDYFTITIGDESCCCGHSSAHTGTISQSTWPLICFSEVILGWLKNCANAYKTTVIFCQMRIPIPQQCHPWTCLADIFIVQHGEGLCVAWYPLSWQSRHCHDNQRSIPGKRELLARIKQSTQGKRHQGSM